MLYALLRRGSLELRRGSLTLMLVAFYVMIAIGSAKESRKPFADVRAHQRLPAWLSQDGKSKYAFSACAHVNVLVTEQMLSPIRRL